MSAECLSRRICKGLDRLGICSITDLGQDIDVRINGFEFGGEFVEVGLSSGRYAYTYGSLSEHCSEDTEDGQKKRLYTCCASFSIRYAKSIS